MICRTAVELINQSLDASIRWSDRLGLGVHVLFCGPCRRFREQIGKLHDMRMVSDTDLPIADSLSAEARDRINSTLEESMRNH